MAAWVRCVGGRPRTGFHKTEHECTSGDTQPRLTIRLWSPCHLDSVISSHGDQQDARDSDHYQIPFAENEEGSALCLAQGTAIPNKLGPVGEGRHPAKT